MIKHRNIADWHGKQLIDCDGGKIGKLEDESGLYHHYNLNYTSPETKSGRRRARR